MNSDLNLCATTLKRGQLQRIEDGQGRLVQCLSGTLWLTQHDDQRDIVLEAGDEALIERDGLSILSALSDARFVLSREPSPLASLRRVRPASAVPARS